MFRHEEDPSNLPQFFCVMGLYQGKDYMKRKPMKKEKEK
jgi:hypothetical protein